MSCVHDILPRQKRTKTNNVRNSKNAHNIGNAPKVKGEVLKMITSNVIYIRKYK